MSTNHAPAHEGGDQARTNYSQSKHAQQQRRALAEEVGRDRLYALDYQDPEVLQRAVHAGYTIEDLAAAFDIAMATVTRWLDKRNVENPRALNHGDAVKEGREQAREQRERFVDEQP